MRAGPKEKIREENDHEVDRSGQEVLDDHAMNTTSGGLNLDASSILSFKAFSAFLFLGGLSTLGVMYFSGYQDPSDWKKVILGTVVGFMFFAASLFERANIKADDVVDKGVLDQVSAAGLNIDELVLEFQKNYPKMEFGCFFKKKN